MIPLTTSPKYNRTGWLGGKTPTHLRTYSTDNIILTVDIDCCQRLHTVSFNFEMYTNMNY